METKRINTENVAEIQIEGNDACKNGKEEKLQNAKSAAVSAAAGLAAGAGIGMAAGAFVNDGFGVEESVESDAGAEISVHDAIADMADGEAYVEPEPVSVPESAVQHTVEPVSPSVADNVPTETVVPETAVSGEDFVAGDFVDAVDTEAPFEVLEYGNVYNVEGESMAYVSALDSQGNEIVMVDVDGDNVLDVVGDTEGNVTDIIVGGISMSDLELNTHDVPGYMAPDETQMADADLSGDIIDPSTLA